VRELEFCLEIGTRWGISWSRYWIFWFHEMRNVLKSTYFLASLEELNFIET